MKDSKEFDNWNEIKKNIHQQKINFQFRQRDIFFMSVGKNVGFEQNGHGKSFKRPVLVLRKFNKFIFLGVPLTSKIKKDIFHYEFEYKKGTRSFAILPQIKLFDIRRACYYDGKISNELYKNLKEKLNKLVFTPPQEQRVCTKAICSEILPKTDPNVKQVFIIAEAGVNHNGDIKIAKKLIDIAASSGANAVKFQTFKTQLCISKNAQKAKYQLETTNKNETQFEMIKKLELDENAHIELLAYCKEKNIMFLSTPFDNESVHLLDKLGLEIFKIPSGEITNLPYLREIAKLNKKIILSTGMANLSEIETAINILTQNGTKRENITLLHANTEYPTPYEDVNLKAMQTIGNAFSLPFGYSDHSLGIEVPIAAVSLGASVIEKHFTLDCNMPGPDHRASLEPNALKAMVKSIRNIELALGDGIKKPSKSESKNLPIARKSIVAKTQIKKGEILSEQNITIKRPGDGISPLRWDEILGRMAIRDFNEDELLEI